MAENKILPNSPEEESSPRIHLSNTLLAALSLILVCAVAWAFFMGFMVGRGQNPKADIESMTGLIPEEKAADAVNIAENNAVHNPPSGEGIKAWPAEVAIPSKPAPQAKPAAQPKPAQNKPRQAPKPAVKPDPGSRYNYTFQIAALRNQTEATNLQKELRAKGLRPEVRKSGKVYILLVNLRGNRDDVENLQNKLKSARLGKPLQLSRTPIETKKK